MKDLHLNLINNDGNNNNSNLLNSTNASLREVQYTNKLYSTNNKCNSKKNVDIKDLFMIFHQNIRGLKVKTEELMISLHNQLPNVICLSVHHMTEHEIDAMHIPMYKLGAKFCRKTKKWRCMYIYPTRSKICEYKFTKILQRTRFGNCSHSNKNKQT